jgi:hypothetical protein
MKCFKEFVVSSRLGLNEGFKRNDYGGTYDADFHDHSDVKPGSLTPEHELAINGYTSAGSNSSYGYASSENMNSMLRNMDGDKTYSITEKHKPRRVLTSIKELSSAFTPENTNRKSIVTHGGIPQHIGHKLISAGKGSEHYIPGFTSTSSDNETAVSFAKKYRLKGSGDPNGAYHVMQYHVQPGAGLSAAANSDYSENEVILHHGARMRYLGHQEIPGSTRKHTMIVHHAIIYPEHKQLEHYGEYNDEKVQ